jgi:DNA-binding response OmpR family regulator
MAKMIWVVDDDTSILDVTAIILKEGGYQTKLFASDQPFIDELTREIPDLILLDVYIANVDGRKIARKLKKQPHTAHVPIILMTADQQIHAGFDHAGAVDYIKKPFDIDQLVTCITKHLKTTK